LAEPESTDDARTRDEQLRRQLLMSLIFPSMLMPMMSTMSRVALPVIRDTFEIPEDVTAWVSAAFTLTFMTMMSVYGRLGDVIDRKKLLLFGITVFFCGTSVTLTADSMPQLILGQMIAGLGVAGMMPLGMALISSFFPARDRGRALGTWATVGPATGFVGSFIAGFLVAGWGWKGAYVTSWALSLFAVIAVWKGIPSNPPARDESRPIRSFDWGGVVLLAAGLACFVCYLSSRAITGVPSLEDWRFLTASVVMLTTFVLRERRHPDPFVAPQLLFNLRFAQSSFCAATRMICMGGLSILIPLYLTDIHGLHPAQLGAMLVINSGSMALIVRIGGGLADRWTSRGLVSVGILIQAIVLMIFSRLPGSSSLLVVGLSLGLHGFGAGLMHAALHRYVMDSVPKERAGAAAGVYNMFRFLGGVIGTSLGGVFLRQYLEDGVPTIGAYQQSFFIFVFIGLVGSVMATQLREKRQLATGGGR
tara:strand:+ start:6223 stop:7653 length:1431 start_codon:yes stop_codon:yes gene_type:complete